MQDIEKHIALTRKIFHTITCSVSLVIFGALKNLFSLCNDILNCFIIYFFSRKYVLY